MAEEEERQNNDRINAEKYKRRIKKGRIYIDVRDKKLNCLLSKEYTRAEAIERMAKAMFEWQRPGSRGDVPIEDVWQNEKCGFENLAEAALNALLEGKNGS